MQGAAAAMHLRPAPIFPPGQPCSRTAAAFWTSPRRTQLAWDPNFIVSVRCHDSRFYSCLFVSFCSIFILLFCLCHLLTYSPGGWLFFPVPAGRPKIAELRVSWMATLLNQMCPHEKINSPWETGFVAILTHRAE